MDLKITGKKITITADIDGVSLSKSRKNVLLFSTRGNLNTGVKYKGRDVMIGANIYIQANKDDLKEE